MSKWSTEMLSINVEIPWRSFVPGVSKKIPIMYSPSDHYYRGSTFWWLCHTSLLLCCLINQTANTINRNEPMGFIEYITIHDKDMVFAIVILHIISLFSYYPIVLSHHFPNHVPITLPYLPSFCHFKGLHQSHPPQQGAQVLPAMSHHKVHPALLCSRALLLERNYVVVVTLQKDRCW